jgi:hypothetical protein
MSWIAGAVIVFDLLHTKRKSPIFLLDLLALQFEPLAGFEIEIVAGEGRRSACLFHQSRKGNSSNDATTPA